MRPIEMLTEEEKQLWREYNRLQKQSRLTEATGEMRAAHNKYKHLLKATNSLMSRYTHAKGTAKKRGIPFEITREQFVDLCNETVTCPILGVTLDYSYRGDIGKGKGNSRSNSASLDRINSSLPYTIDNVQIISHRANEMKNKYTEEQLASDILAAVKWAQRKLEETYVA